MRSQQLIPTVLFKTATAAAAGALLLSGCGGAGQPQTHSTSTVTGPASSSSSSSADPATSATASPSESTATGVERCTTDTLEAATEAGGGAAGSVYLTLLLTNSGSTPCMLMGYPGVSLVAGPEGDPLGAPAVRDETKPPVELLLAPGESGGAQLRYVQAGLYPDCTMVEAAGYRVYPPEDFGSLFIQQPTTACSETKLELLTIGAFQPIS